MSSTLFTYLKPQKKLNTRLKTPKVKNFKTSIKQSDFNWIFLPYD